MILNEIFERPVDRYIEGVIKADDEASLRLEMEEYVLTNEVAKRLDYFLDAYLDYQGSNGVWISGFFGSGKSHLLKMLALLLENRSLDDAAALDLFLQKCKDDALLAGKLKLATAIHSKSILFNIDQKADVISKTQFDALLAVFVKVFDEMCGYYGKQGHIAKFERDMDSRGLYGKFRDAYREVSGQGWEFGREQALLESQNIAEAYSRATGDPKESAVDLLDKYRSEYKVSIEDFAEQVNSYIQHQGPDFRLNFFVDEVGQYIADNVKLMTNLQTIAESLATKCRGRSWIVVTAQEEMKDVIGEMSKQKGTDFSKIQARFAKRIKLTGANVSEVIRKRLLKKNEQGAEKLVPLYNQEANNLKTLFNFADGSKSYRNFKHEDDFVECYPFVPYQFPLFQAAIQNLSAHDAFEGKHHSVGERSMLGVFQQVAMQIADHRIGQLATFDLMFEGIRTTLKSKIQQSILTAEAHLDNKFAVKVLKALFLVKYVKEFKTTPRNLCVLLLDGFDCDHQALRDRVSEALGLLDNEVYIQRNGEEYEYLTDEEKDVEKEIKNTVVETSDVLDVLAKIVFDHVIKNKKIRYEENGQDYPFSRKLDDRLLSREYELAIHMISPLNENAGKEDVLRMQAMGRDEVLVILPPDERFVRDLRMYKKTEKYIQQNIAVSQQASVRRILTDKQLQNRERLAEIEKQSKTLLSQAKLIAYGSDVETATSDPQARIILGFHHLILCTYPNLGMLRSITYTEKDIAACLREMSDVLLVSDLSEAEEEMLSVIQANKNREHVRTTLKSLIETFGRKPYGWYYAAILCILAKLCARGKVEIMVDSNILDDAADLEHALRNTHGHANVVLEPQIEFTKSQVRTLKDFFADFFDRPPAAAEAKALGKEMAETLRDCRQKLEEYLDLQPRYPFLSALEGPMEKLRAVTGKPYVFYLTEFERQHDELHEMKETVLDPLYRFMGGTMKQLYEAGRTLLQTKEPNFAFVEGDEAQQLKTILSDPGCFKGNAMQQVKSLVDTLRDKVDRKLAEEKAKAKESFEALKQKVVSQEEFSALPPEKREQLTRPFDDLAGSLERQTIIAVIRDTLRRFREKDYPRLLEKMCTWAEQKPGPKDGGKDAGDDEPSKIVYVPSRSVKVPFKKPWLANEADVDEYTESMKKALMKEIEAGKRIQV